MNFVAQAGWVVFLPSYTLASVRAGRSRYRPRPHLWSSILSMYHVSSIWVTSFPISFFFFLGFFFFPLVSITSTLTQYWSWSDKMSHLKLDWNYFQRGTVRAKHVYFMKFLTYSQHMGSKLWTSFEPWELWVGKMGLIYNRKKGSEDCWISFLFLKRTFWWVKCKWVRNTWILFPLPYAWV